MIIIERYTHAENGFKNGLTHLDIIVSKSKVYYFYNSGLFSDDYISDYKCNYDKLVLKGYWIKEMISMPEELYLLLY